MPKRDLADAGIDELLKHFHRQRPVRAGSLLITLLGDSIAPRGGSIALSSLIQLTLPFGLTERLIRTSIARLANENWVESTRSGRLSFYNLTASGRARFAEATERIYAASPSAWDGRWTVVIDTGSAKEVREAARLELRWLGFGQATPGVFVHPTYSEEAVRAHLKQLKIGADLVILKEAKTAPAGNAQLAAMGWDFQELQRRYARFIAMFAPFKDARFLNLGASAEQAFILRSLLLHEYRKIHLRDPLLPEELLPPKWSGTHALDLCRSVYARAFPASEEFLTRVGETLSGRLPPPAQSVYRRFGGL